MENLQTEKIKFLEANIEYLVFMSSFAQGRKYPVYRRDRRDVSDTDKKEFKKCIVGKLQSLAENYRQKQDFNKNEEEEKHLHNIENLQKELNSDWQNILYPHEKEKIGTLTFGRVQKLLNLYLKYSWVLGWIDQPPHCPIDSIILNKIKSPKPSWQSPQFKKEEYFKAINKCKIEADKTGVDIAEWELRVFNNKGNKDIEVKKCLCNDPACAKCLLINCQDDNCKIHTKEKKEEQRKLRGIKNVVCINQVDF